MTDSTNKQYALQQNFEAVTTAQDTDDFGAEADYGDTGHDIIGASIEYSGGTAHFRGLALGQGCYITPKHEA